MYRGIFIRKRALLRCVDEAKSEARKPLIAATMVPTSPDFSKNRVTIRGALVARGLHEKDVARKIRSKIFPWHARVIDNVRLLLGGDPFTAESQFVRDVADCTSHDELNDCLFSYSTNPDRKNHLVSRILGLTPRRSQVFALYKELKPRKV